MTPFRDQKHKIYIYLFLMNYQEKNQFKARSDGATQQQVRKPPSTTLGLQTLADIVISHDTQLDPAGNPAVICR